MKQQTAGTGTIRAESTPRDTGRLVTERSGTPGESGFSGVSDARRAQLERLQADAGMAPEAADESVPQRSEPEGAAAGLRNEPAPELASRVSSNPDIDKR